MSDGYFFFSYACSLLTEGSKVTRVNWVEEEFLVIREGVLQKHENGKFSGYVLSDCDLKSVVWKTYERVLPGS